MFKITSNDVYGRYLVAERDIKPGELIMKERPLLLGSPNAAFIICFKCADRIYTRTPTACEDCGVAPTCNMCHGTFHAQECSTLAKSGLTLKFLCENPQVSMPLRCLLLKQYNENSWNEFNKLEAHLSERRDSCIFNIHRTHVEMPLKQAGLQFFEQVQTDGSSIQQICAVLDVNTFEVRPRKDFHGAEDFLRGLYLQPALMAHNCVCNTHLSIDSDFTMTVRAATSIKKEGIISFNYSNGLLGNIERQKHLQQGKYFRCMCQRCSDGTELGTGLSSLVCAKCTSPSIVCQDEKKMLWQCTQCLHIPYPKMINTTIMLARDRIQEALNIGDLHKCTQLSVSLRRTFHPQHALLIELNQKIISLLCLYDDPASMLKKISLCKDLIKVLRIIEPGISRHQGIALYEMYRAMISLSKLQFNKLQETYQSFLIKLTDAESVLKEAVGHLIYEPKSSPEGRLAQKALTDLHVLRDTMRDIENRSRLKQAGKRKNKS